MNRLKIILTGLFILRVVFTYSQNLSSQREAVIDTLLRLVDTRYVYPDVARKITAYIKNRQRQHAYDTITRGETLARILTADLRLVSNDGHLGVEYSPAVIKEVREESAPSPEVVREFRQQGATDNFHFRKLEILEGNVGYLKLDAFWPTEWISDTAAGAMAFLKNADAIILDLRDNHGFADGGILIQSYFFNEPTYMSDYINRDDGTTRQSWTMPVVPGTKLPDTKLYILVSKETFSAGEDFTYNMQAQKRAMVVGEVTGGGAHGTRAYRLSDHFSAGIPHVYSVNPITKTDWEGKGVQPDIRAARKEALRVAHIDALKSIIANSKDKVKEKALMNVMERLEKSYPER
jgi:retinol-binding protein 3